MLYKKKAKIIYSPLRNKRHYKMLALMYLAGAIYTSQPLLMESLTCPYAVTGTHS